MFSVNILFYGNTPGLVVRCLLSVIHHADWSLIAEVRLGLNAVSEWSRRLIMDEIKSVPVPCTIYQERDNRNVGKYPLMRRMFYDGPPLAADRVMWFDDDSYLNGGRAWWKTASAVAQQADMVGSVYRLPKGFRGNQPQAIAAQPWYTGKPVERPHQPSFCTGGWWIIKTEILKRWDWPHPALFHNGGDSMLGELCRQQGYVVKHWREGVAINADNAGRESKAERRGLSTPWVWTDWRPDKPDDLSHHDFECVYNGFRLPLGPPPCLLG